MTWLFVERMIDEAVRKGFFDRLPGPFGPLDLSENPYVPAEWRLAVKLLADHRILPEFIERRKEIEEIRADIERLKADRTRSRDWKRLAIRNRLLKLSLAVEARNGCLARENQFVRSSFQRPPVDVEAELSTWDRPLGAGPPSDSTL